MRHPRGSQWCKWDLHVHTPQSLVQEYGGDTPEAWESFFSDIEALPPEFKVLGINDYIFLEGYRRVLDAREQGRLQNIDLVLPVIELRIDKFGGSAGHLRRLNLHVIFSDTVGADVIEQQFLGALSSQYCLNPEHTEVTWSGVPTPQALEDLGSEIIASVPPRERRRYGSPLIEGFNNLSLRVEQVLSALDKPYFHQRALTAVGKTEWASIRWQDGSIADKKNIINGVDFVFIAAASDEHCQEAKASLLEAGVNSRLLDCSDAHCFADSENKDRIGHCYTWINADTEFEGLCQVRKEADERVFLGEEPEPKRRVALSPTRYIDEVRIRKATTTFPEPWFDGVNLPLNSGLVAVIGNRGSGKSALVDILGLLGDSQRQGEASFLSVEQFRRPADNKAKHFMAQLLWADGTRVRRSLEAEVEETATERVTYVPQKLFDTICNELESTEAEQFDQELKRVIFSHVAESDRLQCSDVDGLIEYKSSELETAIAARRERLSAVNRDLVRVERQLRPEHRRTLENQLAVKKRELEVHEGKRPAVVEPPKAEPDAAMQAILSDLEKVRESERNVEEKLSAQQDRQTTLKREIAVVERVEERLANLRERVQEVEAQTEADLQPLGIRREDVLDLRLNTQPLIDAKRTRDAELQSVEVLLGVREAEGGTPDEESLPAQAEKLASRRKELQGQLDEPQERYQAYVTSLAEWEEARSVLTGTETGPESITGLEATLAALDGLPADRDRLLEDRKKLASEIHRQLVRLMDVYRNVYKPVQRFVDETPMARDQFGLRVDVRLVDGGFGTRFLEHFINKQRLGSFAGIEEGAKRVRDLLAETDFGDEEQAVAFAERILEQLSRDYRSPARSEVRVADQLRQGRLEEELYDFLFGFGYLQVRFGLKMGDRDLAQLSPGEKGALLLMFYLLVDRSERPLIIDQPEENLDNQTIFSLLVPSVRAAKKRRQIIIVTHNPNLAVVCDADQVIHASRTQEGDTRVTYESGAIENPVMNRHVLDVLEGTRKAFDNRSGKYIA